MSKEIEKKSKSKFFLKAMVVATISGVVWKIILAVLDGYDKRGEN